MTEKAAFVADAEAIAPLEVVGEKIRVLAPASRTGSYEIFLQTGPEGAGPPPHTHPWDEAYFVLEGKLEVLMGDRSVTLSAGGFAHIPRGTKHGFRFVTAGAKFLSINSNRGAAEFFTDLDRETSGSMDIPKLVAVAMRHEVALAAP